jgi:hypothetical protein
MAYGFGGRVSELDRPFDQELLGPIVAALDSLDQSGGYRGNSDGWVSGPPVFLAAEVSRRLTQKNRVDVAFQVSFSHWRPKPFRLVTGFFIDRLATLWYGCADD